MDTRTKYISMGVGLVALGVIVGAFAATLRMDDPESQGPNATSTQQGTSSPTGGGHPLGSTTPAEPGGPTIEIWKG